MIYIRIIILIKYLLTLILFFNLSPLLFSQETSNLILHEGKKEELYGLIKNYILDNPEIIIEAIEIFQKKTKFECDKKRKRNNKKFK